MVQHMFETLASDTYQRLREADRHCVRFGEETITDLLLLDLKRHLSPRVTLIQTPKSDEATKGTDFEMWLSAGTGPSLRFAVQAKRLKIDKQQYLNLRYKVKGNLQIDKLENYASSNSAIPIYCLYNYPTAPPTKAHWHCCKYAFSKEQFGCTVTPSAVIRGTFGKRGTKNFDYIHKDQHTIPWRCLACCPKLKRVFFAPTTEISIDPITEIRSMFNWPARQYKRLPDEIIAARDTNRIERFPSHLYDSNVGYPRRVVVVDVLGD